MDKRIILGVTGSISAYKAADLVSQLKKRNYDVHVVMSKSACEFITPLTMQSMSQNLVLVDVMEEPDPKIIQHVKLAQSADLLLIAPATANTISKLAYGLADDMLSNIALVAHKIPRVFAPAMNTDMYENPVIEKNRKSLMEAGWQMVEPRSTRLACGDLGIGALAEVEDIVDFVDKVLEEA